MADITFALVSRLGAIRLNAYLAASGQASNNLAAGKSIYFKNVVANPLGPIAHPIHQSIPVLDDAFDRVSGLLVNTRSSPTRRRDWRIIDNALATGDQQVLGGAVFDAAGNNVIDSIIEVTPSVVTTKIGSTSGGAQYKASAATTAGTNIVTPFNRVVTSTSIYRNTSGTGYRAFITGEKITTP